MEERDSIITKVLEYIINTYKTSIKDIYNNTQDYIIKLLQSIRCLKYREIDIRKERKKIVEDLEDLQRAYVGGENLNLSEEGKNTGGKKNKVELRQLKMLELRESLREKINESLVLEKSLKDSTKLFKDFFELIPNAQYQAIIVRMYLGCDTSSEIADDYCYSKGTVNIYRTRGIKSLTNILHEFISKTRI